MAKRDLKKEMKALYKPSAKEVAEVDVPVMSFLMIDGKGDPNTSEEYGQAVEALFSLSYALKFAIKKRQAVDYAVMPLEGLWWMKSGGAFRPDRKADFEWTAMILQPEYVSADLVDEVREEVRAKNRKKKKEMPGLARVRFEDYAEGRAVHIMHRGPYDEEGPTIERLHQYAEERGLSLRGKHHEIYLKDPSRTAPEKLETIVRQPVE